MAEPSRFGATVSFVPPRAAVFRPAIDHACWDLEALSKAYVACSWNVRASAPLSITGRRLSISASGSKPPCVPPSGVICFDSCRHPIRPAAVVG